MKTLLKLLLAAFAVLSAHAATYTVTTSADAGPGSLRQAILDANANGGADTINFAAALNGQKILLTSGPLNVANGVSIVGPGPSQLAIDGNGNGSVFVIDSAQSNFIAGLTITNGHALNTGGGIYNNADSLTLSNVVLSGNSAGNGGGAIANVVFVSGGSATLTLQNCTLSGNSATSGGGAIYNLGDSGDATLTVQNCTLSSNSAGSVGGSIYNEALSANATVTLQNCTLSGNSAQFGGGIYSYGYSAEVAALTLQDCTLSGNSSTNTGSGCIDIDKQSGGTSTLTITHTLLAHGSGRNFPSHGGTVSNLGYNLSDDNTTTSFATTVANLFLGPLANNGGPTLTHALLSSSPAINAGDPSFTGPPAYDQRGPGFPRVLLGRIDIGAFEAACIGAVTVISTNDSGAGTLRQALADICAGGTITFDPALTGKTITLTNGQLTVAENVSIVGPGPGQLTVRRSAAGGTPTFRLLAVNSGVTANISGLTLSNGNAGDGGGLHNDGMLTVSNCVIAGNNSSGNGGGGIYSVGTLTVADCTLSNNSSSASGGAISQSSGGSTTLNRCTFSGNAATNGGALFNQMFTQINPFPNPPTYIPAYMNITNCTFSGNSATSGGSVAFNVAINGQAPAQLVMLHCTVSGNIGSFALYNLASGASAPFFVGGSVVGNNGNGPDTFGAGAAVISLGYNLVSRADGFAVTTGDQYGTAASPLDPLLGPLANNGGPTLTQLPLLGSPAVDAGNTNTTGFPATDQRGPGFPRILNGRIDIGAVEATPRPAPPASVLINPVWSSASNAFQFSFTNVAGAGFTILASTNVALPLSNWTALGIASEPSSGQYQFVDTQTTNASRKFYRVRWP